MDLTHTTTPKITGTSVVAVKYAEGVIMCTDTLASFGSLARFSDVPRMAAIGPSILLGASGEYSDFQEVLRLLREKEATEHIDPELSRLNTGHFASYLAGLLYKQRNLGDPYFNSFLMAGYVGSDRYLAYLDMYGTHLLGDYLATGFAQHLGKPILASEWREGMSELQAKELLQKVMKVLWHRDARASDRVQFAKLTPGAVTFEESFVLEDQFDHESYMSYVLNPLFPYN